MVLNASNKKLTQTWSYTSQKSLHQFWFYRFF